MTTPPHECPTRTTGPSASLIARLVAATSFSSESRGFWTVTTFSPASSSIGMTFCHDEPSANAPCTSTAVLALSSAAETAVTADRKKVAPIMDLRIAIRHLHSSESATRFIKSRCHAVSIRRFRGYPDKSNGHTVASPRSEVRLFCLAQCFEQNLRRRAGRGRVLPGDQLTV